jgi:hypothetical protein
MIREHVDAILTRLRADSTLAGIVLDGAADPNEAVVLPPYVVVYVDSGTRSVEREASEQPTAAEFRIVTHAVGVDANQARFFADKVMGQFLGWRPTVTGWAPQAVQHSRSQPVQADTSVSPASQYIADVFKLTSRKA